MALNHTPVSLSHPHEVLGHRQPRDSRNTESGCPTSSGRGVSPGGGFRATLTTSARKPSSRRQVLPVPRKPPPGEDARREQAGCPLSGSLAWRGTRPRNEPPDTGIYTPASAWYFPRSFPRPPRAQVAQLVEQRTENPRVGGSIPSLGTTFNPSKINGLGSRVLDMCSIRVVRPTIRENCDAYSVSASPEVLPAQGATVSAMLLPHPS